MHSLEILHGEISELNDLAQSENVENDLQEEEDCTHISLNALSGLSTYQTMRIKGHGN